MRPFTEYVHPATGHKQRVSWDRDRSNAKLQEFCAKAKESLRVRDIERARAVGLQVASDISSLPTCAFEKDGSFVVDVLASKVKHSGDEYSDLVTAGWQEFCSKPQNEEDAEYPMVMHKPRTTEIAEPPIRTLEEVKAEGKRGPGRPRRQALVNV